MHKEAGLQDILQTHSKKQGSLFGCATLRPGLRVQTKDQKIPLPSTLNVAEQVIFALIS